MSEAISADKDPSLLESQPCLQCLETSETSRHPPNPHLTVSTCNEPESVPTTGISSHKSSVGYSSDELSNSPSQGLHHISNLIKTECTEVLKTHIDRTVSELKHQLMGEIRDISQKVNKLEEMVKRISNQPGSSHNQNFVSRYVPSSRSMSHISLLPQDSTRASQRITIPVGLAHIATTSTDEIIQRKENITDEVTMARESCATADMKPQLQKDSTRASIRSTTSNDSVKTTAPIEATTPEHETIEGTADEMTLTLETIGTQHVQMLSNGKASVNDRADLATVVPKLIDTSSIVNECTANFEIHCICQQQMVPLIQSKNVYLNYTSQTTGRRLSVGSKSFSGYIEQYSLVDDSTDKKTFSNRKKYVCPTVLFYVNKITILGGSSDSGANFKLGLYQLTHKPHYTLWELVLNSKFSPLQFELKNSICIEYGNDEVVVVSVSTQVMQEEFIISLVLHLFSPTPIAGKYWRSLNIALPNTQSCDGRKYKIQSGIILENDLYCSLLLQGTKALVCTVDLTCLQKYGKEADVPCWSLADALLCDCFLSLYGGEVVAVTFKNISDKTVMEVRWCSNYFTSSLEYQFEFPSIVQVRSVAASVTLEMPNTLVIVYHDVKSNKCFVKKFNICQ